MSWVGASVGSVDDLQTAKSIISRLRSQSNAKRQYRQNACVDNDHILENVDELNRLIGDTKAVAARRKEVEQHVEELIQAPVQGIKLGVGDAEEGAGDDVRWSKASGGISTGVEVGLGSLALGNTSKVGVDWVSTSSNASRSVAHKTTAQRSPYSQMTSPQPCVDSDSDLGDDDDDAEFFKDFVAPKSSSSAVTNRDRGNSSTTASRSGSVQKRAAVSSCVVHGDDDEGSEEEEEEWMADIISGDPGAVSIIGRTTSDSTSPAVANKERYVRGISDLLSSSSSSSSSSKSKTAVIHNKHRSSQLPGKAAAPQQGPLGSSLAGPVKAGQTIRVKAPRRGYHPSSNNAVAKQGKS